MGTLFRTRVFPRWSSRWLTTTSYEAVGYQPFVHSEVTKVGLGKPNGKLHKAPWNKKKNVDVVTSRVDHARVVAPVARTHVDALPLAVANTHYDVYETRLGLFC